MVACKVLATGRIRPQMLPKREAGWEGAERFVGWLGHLKTTWLYLGIVGVRGPMWVDPLRFCLRSPDLFISSLSLVLHSRAAGNWRLLRPPCGRPSAQWRCRVSVDTLADERIAARPRPHRSKHTGAIPTSAVNCCRARSVLGWGTAWEVPWVLRVFTISVPNGRCCISQRAAG